MVHQNKCPLCCSENIGQHLQTRDHFLSREPFELFKCSDCGFVFTQDYPEENSIGRYYASDKYISHNDSASGFLNNLYRLSRAVMLRKKRSVVRRFTGLKRGSLLDIGSGTGHFIAVMKEAGWTVKGIEINEKAREFSVSRLGVEVISQEHLSSLLSASFDCITLWHVLEHFHEPNKYASEIVRLLKPGGTCIVALPNCASFDAKYYREYWAAYDVPRHLWHFTPSAFCLFAEKAGLEIRKIRSLPLDVYYISLLSEKYKGSRISYFGGVLKGFMFAVRSLFRMTGSSSLIYFLRKETD
ncbi:MAG: methyltransferase domain-containing protein [Bacteroidales bacterium]|nr:methyltransferase domain-containing protein [Bacteroidales bacterium]